MPSQIIPSLNLLQVTTRSNTLVSALNTNVMVAVLPSLISSKNIAIPFLLRYSTLLTETCNVANSAIPSGFYPFLIDTMEATDSISVPVNIPNIGTFSIVSGFFEACTPLEAILVSTLDCLYEVTCIELLLEYFPRLSHVCKA